MPACLLNCVVSQCHEHLSTHTVNNTLQVSCFCIVCISSEVVMRPRGEFCESSDTWTTWRYQKNTYDHCECIINLCWHCETGLGPYVQELHVQWAVHLYIVLSFSFVCMYDCHWLFTCLCFFYLVIGVCHFRQETTEFCEKTHLTAGICLCFDMIWYI
jgi:hypothetical protein